jgi:hypothetical protein
MDRRRCLDLMIADFARETEEKIAFSGNGSVAFWREFRSQKDAARRLRFWMHFVHFPPQRYSATNALMMGTPPVCTTLPASGGSKGR